MSKSRTTGKRLPAARRDLLEEHSRKAVLALVAVALLLLILSAEASETIGLPGIALGWKLGLEIVRAALVFAIVTFVAIVLLRGWGGMWPYRFSTTGLDYEKVSLTAAELAMQVTDLERLKAELQQAGRREST